MDAYDSFILLLTGVGFCVVLFLNSIILEIEALSDFAVMEMHKKCSCLITLHAKLLFWALDCIFLSYFSLAVAHCFSEKGENNLIMHAQMQIVL